MKNHYIATILCALLINTLSFAQNKNTFHDAEFWKEKPSTALIKEKIADGNDPEAFNGYAFDATVFAIMNDAPYESILYLLSLPGNNVDKITHDSRNYLQWAAYKGNVALVDYLLKRGSNIALVDSHGFTALTFAANAGQVNSALYDTLIEGGASLKETDHDGANAVLLLCLHTSDISQLTYFFDKGLSIKTKDALGNTAFFYAARSGNIDFMNMLIKEGVDYKTPNAENANPLIYAGYGKRGHVNGLDVYTYLEGLGLDANIVSTKGVNPLHAIAYKTKDTTIFNFFIQRGVDVNQVNEDGNTVFLNALMGGNMEIAQYLLPKVKDINLQNKKGYSALSYAALNYASQKSNADFLDVLLGMGANVKVKDANGDNLVYHFFTMYDKIGTEQKAYFLRLFKTNNMSLTNTYSEGKNLYHIAVKENISSLLEKANELGIDINQKNEAGLAPIHIAAMKATDTTTLIWLISHGANLKILTEFGESVYQLASENEILTKSNTKLKFLKK